MDASIELPRDRQEAVEIRARDVLLPNKVLGPLPGRGSNVRFQTRPRANRKRESKDTLNKNTLQWLKQWDNEQDSQKVADTEEQEPGSFRFFNPSLNEGAVSASDRTSWPPGVDGKRSGRNSAANATGATQRSASVSASIGGSSREHRLGYYTSRVEEEDSEDDDAAHNRRDRRSWRHFFCMGQGGRDNAWGSCLGVGSNAKAGANRTKSLPPSRERQRQDGKKKWHGARSFAKGGRSVSGEAGGRRGAGRNGSTPSTPSTILSVGTNSTLGVASNNSTVRGKNGTKARPGASLETRPQAKENPRPAVVASAGDAGAAGLAKKENTRESRDKGVDAPAPAGTDSSRRQSSRAGGSSKLDQLIQQGSRTSSELDGQEKRRRRSRDRGSRTGENFVATAEAGGRLSVKLEGLENHRGGSRDSGSRADGVVTAEAGGRLSVKLEGLENRRGGSRNSGTRNDENRVATAEAGGRLSVKLEGLEYFLGGSRDRGRSRNGENRGSSSSMDRLAAAEVCRVPDKRKGPEDGGRRTRDGSSSSSSSSSSRGGNRVAAAVATTHSRSSRSPPRPPAAKAEARGGNKGSGVAAAGAGGGSCNGEVDADSRGASSPSGGFAASIPAPLDAAVVAGSNEWGGDRACADQNVAAAAAAPRNRKSDGAPPPSSNDRQGVAPAAAAIPRPARLPAAARTSVYWRQTTGSLEIIQDHLFKIDRSAYAHDLGRKAFQVGGGKGHPEGKAEESTATAVAAPPATNPRGASAARGVGRPPEEEAKAPPLRQPMSVWVAQHIDKSSRHGVAFLMSDGSVVMRFRDDTVMVSEPMPRPGDWEDRGALEYFTKDDKGKASASPLRFIPEDGDIETEEGEEQRGRGTNTTADGGRGGAAAAARDRRKSAAQVNRARYTMKSVPPRLEKKKRLLATFRGRLLALAASEDAGRGGGGVDRTVRGDEGGGDGGSRAGDGVGAGVLEAPPNQPWEPSVLVEAYRPTKDSCLFVLSDSTIQMSFSDRTKILLSGDNDLVTFIHADGARERETVSFARAVKDNRYADLMDKNVTHITERVNYSKRLIHQLQEKERDVGGGGGEEVGRRART